MKEIQKLNIGDNIDDLVCIGKTMHRIGLKQYPTYYYIMKCKICGRTKEMLSSTIRRHCGTTHKACGKTLKTKDRTFYDRWQAMRTRTTNPNYAHSQNYSEKGINSDAFKYFIDFYDTMYESYKKLADIIGPENTSLERIDNNENYTPNNCKWIDKHDQPRHTSKIIKFKATFPDGHTEIHENINKFAREHNLDASTIRDCMNPNRSCSHHKHYKFERL